MSNERVITVYGRMPVLEALLDQRAEVDSVVLSRSARGESVERILAAAARRGIRVQRADATRVTRISGNSRHDQGVVAAVASPGLAELESWLGTRAAGAPLALVLLDGLTNPANVGMVIRTATAAGLQGVVVPRAGSPDIGPLVIKASAGVALSAPVLRAPTAAGAARCLASAGVALVGLAAGTGPTVWDVTWPERVAFVVGNETTGVSGPAAELIGSWCSIPLHGGVDSLNVACAAAVVAYEVARRKDGGRPVGPGGHPAGTSPAASHRPGAPATTM